MIRRHTYCSTAPGRVHAFVCIQSDPPRAFARLRALLFHCLYCRKLRERWVE